ncbi:hypothetical protein BDV41DRAFT_125718 [Aspergillus transmontanensis]|uniref:Uncharacterized protein n=1 Tax=Aspergillus transmontanensis TaxID=1034304 RepID=A0A5N6WA95_9EURO|nr:hypothetical protein BDV41DRAFT_125718 [Aspergillus transmontanensis]
MRHPFHSVKRGMQESTTYSFDSMLEIEVQRVLMNLEKWFIKLDPTTRGDCRTKKKKLRTGHPPTCWRLRWKLYMLLWISPLYRRSQLSPQFTTQFASCSKYL